VLEKQSTSQEKQYIFICFIIIEDSLRGKCFLLLMKHCLLLCGRRQNYDITTLSIFLLQWLLQIPINITVYMFYHYSSSLKFWPLKNMIISSLSYFAWSCGFLKRREKYRCMFISHQGGIQIMSSTRCVCSTTGGGGGGGFWLTQGVWSVWPVFVVVFFFPPPAPPPPPPRNLSSCSCYYIWNHPCFLTVLASRQQLQWRAKVGDLLEIVCARGIRTCIFLVLCWCDWSFYNCYFILCSCYSSANYTTWGNWKVLYFSSFQLMRGYCEEALRYGEMPVLNGGRSRQITVILNPVANKRYVKGEGIMCMECI
jgi:hypothetical protein